MARQGMKEYAPPNHPSRHPTQSALLSFLPLALLPLHPFQKVEQATPAPAPVASPPMRAPTFCALDSAADIPGLMSEDGSTCCAEICPECLPANEDCIGILDCCASEIQSSNIMCADSVEGPCIISSCESRLRLCVKCRFFFLWGGANEAKEGVYNFSVFRPRGFLCNSEGAREQEASSYRYSRGLELVSPKPIHSTGGVRV